MPSADPSYPGFTAHLFGTFKVYIAGVPLRKLRAQSGNWLLALLILRHGRWVDRTWLAETLWPESDLPVARDNLRHMLSDLRDALGSEAIRLTAPTASTLSLNLVGADVDVLCFDAAIKEGTLPALEQAAALHVGVLLKCCRNTWVCREREARHTQYHAALAHLAQHADRERKPSLAANYLRRIYAEAPLQEEVVRRLMEVLAADGDYEGAMQVYRELRARIANTFKSLPDTATIAAYHEIRAADRQQRLARMMPEAPPAVPVGAVPKPLIRLLGRDQAVWEVLACLEHTRLVTLTGTGGIGKTQLALKAAQEAWPDYPAGVWFVDLSEVRSGVNLAGEFVRVLGIPGQAGAAEKALLRALKSRCLLLILDNCEHLLSACAHLVRRILSACKSVRVLATSRQSLGLAGERLWRVPSLALPEEPLPIIRIKPTDTDLASLRDYSAVELFIQRATQARPEFSLTTKNALSIVRLCRRLDGIPLAIELAAAWARSLPIEQITQRIVSHFDLLTNGDPTALPRHQTLRAAMTWSYDLLSEPEQRLWQELALFTGGWTLEAAESVCLSANPVSPLVQRLDRLVHASVVLYTEADEEGRYRLPEILRQFGAEKRAENSYAEADLHKRHLDYFVQWAEMVEPHLVGADQALWLARLEQERGNLHQALEWARESQKGEIGLRLANALWRFWYARGDYREGQTWLQIFLKLAPDAPASFRLKAAGASGNLAYRQGDYPKARTYFTANLKLARALERPRAIASALGNLGNVTMDEGRLIEAYDYFEQCLAHQRNLRDERGITLTLGNLANVSSRAGNYLRAIHYHEESIARFREQEDPLNLAMALANFADTKLSAQEYTTLLPLLSESIQISYALGHLHNVSQCLLVCLAVAVYQGKSTAAALLIGAWVQIDERIEIALPHTAQVRYQSDRAEVESKMNSGAFAQTVSEGRLLTPVQIMALLSQFEQPTNVETYLLEEIRQTTS